MKLRNPLPKVLGLFLFAIAIQVSLNSQTRWSVIQKLSNVDDDVSRVTYENGGFNFVWQETDYWSPWDEGGPVYVQRFGDNPSPSLPFRLRIVDSEMGGWPNSKSGKELYIHYATDEGEFVATIQEGDYLHIPDDSHDLVGPPLARDTVSILEARYESVNRSVDVSALLEFKLFADSEKEYDLDIEFSSFALEADGTPLFVGGAHPSGYLCWRAR